MKEMFIFKIRMMFYAYVSQFVFFHTYVLKI